MNFLAGLSPEYKNAKTEILSSSETSLQEAFIELLQIDKAQSMASLHSNDILGCQSSEYCLEN